MKLIPQSLLAGAFVLLAACSSKEAEAPPPAAANAPPAKPAVYSMEDFARVRKLDAHVHINVLDSTFLEQARADNFEVMAINVDYPDFPKLADQRAAALVQVKADPARIHWATTFSVKGFEKKDWLAKVNAQLAADS